MGSRVEYNTQDRERQVILQRWWTCSYIILDSCRVRGPNKGSPGSMHRKQPPSTLVLLTEEWEEVAAVDTLSLLLVWSKCVCVCEERNYENNSF
jgi:hypothetical protein